MLKKINKKNGSTLVVALLVLSTILISTLSMTLVIIKERIASIGDVDSAKAYQLAETGIEKVMQLITRGNYDYINKAGGSNNLYDDLPGDINCNLTSGLLEATDESFIVEFFDKSDPAVKINCNDSSALVSDIARIKSIGVATKSKRATNAFVLNKATKLLLHFNGNSTDYSFFSNLYDIAENGGVSFIDSIPQTVEKKEYANFSASGDYLQIQDKDATDEIDFNFLDNDFTIEAWVNIKNSTDSLPTIISQWVKDKHQFRFFYNNISTNANYQKLGFQYATSGGGDTFFSNRKNLLDGWHHVVLERNNANIYFFIDGYLEGTVNIGAQEINNLATQEDIYIGGSLEDDSSTPKPLWQFIGYMDELRITKDMTRFAADFTPWEIEYAPND